MTNNTQAVFQEAMSLNEAERAELIARLLETLESAAEPSEHPALSDAWQAEIQRRVRRVQSGEAELVKWPELRNRLWARLHELPPGLAQPR